MRVGCHWFGVVCSGFEIYGTLLGAEGLSGTTTGAAAQLSNSLERYRALSRAILRSSRLAVSEWWSVRERKSHLDDASSSWLTHTRVLQGPHGRPLDYVNIRSAQSSRVLFTKSIP